MAANYDPQLLHNITWDSLNTLDLSEDTLAFARGALERVTEIMQERDRANAQVDHDPTLTPLGKEPQHAGSALQKTSDMIAELRRLGEPTPLPRDSASTTALLIERRHVIRDLDTDVLAVGVLYLDSARLRDDVTLAAIDTAPPSRSHRRRRRRASSSAPASRTRTQYSASAKSTSSTSSCAASSPQPSKRLAYLTRSLRATMAPLPRGTRMPACRRHDRGTPL